MKVKRYLIFNQDNISCVGFETKEEALKQCEFMKNYHNMYFYVKEVFFEVEHERIRKNTRNY